jgi:hypothetical protein
MATGEDVHYDAGGMPISVRLLDHIWQQTMAYGRCKFAISQAQWGELERQDYAYLGPSEAFVVCRDLPADEVHIETPTGRVRITNLAIPQEAANGNGTTQG